MDRIMKGEWRKGGGEPEEPDKVEPRRVLVTGGAGFIGSHVADAYLSLGDEVWIVDDLSSGRRENVPARASFVEMSVCDAGLQSLMEEVRFHVVNHHAAQVDVRRSVEDPGLDAGINVLGLLNVLEGARATGVMRMVYVSSGGVVYGEPELRPTPETAPKRPLSPYGVSKLAGEYYLGYYRAVHGIETVALRYSNVYGPRQDPHGEAGVVAIFFQRLLRGGDLTIFGDGEQTRDYVYVGDVVRANLLVSDLRFPADAGMDDRAFNVGTGVETSVNRLAEIIETVSETRAGRSHRAKRAGELVWSVLDVSHLKALGWAPRTPLTDGLRETFRWISAQEAAS